MQEYISTRWYRSPECLLTSGYYNYKMDVWGTGCVFFEMLSLFPLFPGKNEKDQIHKIHNILGTPSREIIERFQRNATNIDFNFPHITGTGINQLIPHVSVECQELIGKLLAYDPDERMSTRQALNSPYFKEIREQELRAAQMVHRELGGGSPTSTGDGPCAFGPDYYPTKQASKPVEEEHGKPYIKWLQQGSSKPPDYVVIGPERVDKPNNVRLARHVGSCRI